MIRQPELTPDDIRRISKWYEAYPVSLATKEDTLLMLKIVGELYRGKEK